MTWLVPHQLAQVLPVDVDYRVMLTFLEFYETMLQFVNFKLYTMLEVRLWPKNIVIFIMSGSKSNNSSGQNLMKRY